MLARGADDGLAHAVAIFDPLGDLVDRAPELEALTGWSFAALRGAGYLRVFHPDDRVAVADAWATARGGTDAVAFEARIERAEGGDRGWRAMRVRLVSHRDEDGVRISFVGTFNEVPGDALPTGRDHELRALLGAMSDVVLVLDEEGRCERIVPTSPGRDKIDASSLVGQRAHDRLPKPVADAIVDTVRRALATRLPERVEYRALAGGRMRWFNGTATALDTNDGDGRGRVLYVVRDVTNRHEQETALAESEERLRMALDVAGLTVWEHELPPDDAAPDADVVPHRRTDRAGEANVSPLDEFFSRVHPADRRAVAAARRRLIRGARDAELEFRATRPDGAAEWRYARARLVAPAADRPARVVGVSVDVTARKRAELAREQTLSLLRATLESTGDGILAVDLDGVVTSHNQRLTELWGIDPAGYIGHRARDLFETARQQLVDPDANSRRVEALMADPTAESFDLLQFLDGRALERVSKPQRVGDEIVGRVWSYRDVTDRVALEERLTHQAYHDALTGLANRARFHHRVERALGRAGVQTRRIAVLLLDLDGFKLVNDSLGHAAGDTLLVQVAERLLNATRGCDTVARLGGDEFGVLLENARGQPDAEIVAERVLRAFDAPFVVGGVPTVVGTSVGIALGDSLDASAATLPGDHGAHTPIAPVEALIRNADLALYDAKSAGKGRYAVYHASLHSAAVERLALEAALRGAIARDELRLVYQPIVDMDEGRIVGLEALLRWHHPTRGLIPPLEFIPIAEETGQIVPLGRWVLEQACVAGARWNAERARRGDPSLTITVNVSGRQIYDAAFVDDVARTLAASGLSPAHLVLELTESTVLHQPDVALERLDALKTLGVRLAIDDFGTGYSALSYLQRFPIDVLKIDKSFVDRVTQGGSHAALARAIVALGDALSLRMIAEGVESADQRATLHQMGCGLAQGYLFARPMQPAALERMLDEARDVVPEDRPA